MVHITNVMSGHDRDGQVSHRAVLPAAQWRGRHHGEAWKPDQNSV